MEQVFNLVNEMSPFLLLGFLLAGLMHVFVPGQVYNRYLSGGNFRAVLYAALFGIPLPLCSCGVLPTAMSLRREGASKGATVSFLIATPQTGIDSIIATYSLMGLPFAILRPIAALFTSILGGQAVNILENENNKPFKPKGNRNHTQDSENANLSIIKRLGNALQYGFVDMMRDIGKWLIIGLVVAGLITVFVPDSFFITFADKPLLSMLLVLVCAIPMYLCATGSIPIAVALMLKGLSPGTALVLLMAGPAANVASILVINKVLGRKTLLIYLASIISGAILFGLGIDYLLPREWFVPSIADTSAHCTGENAIEWFNLACTITLALLLTNALTLRFRKKAETPCKATTCETPQPSTATQQSEIRIFNIEGMRCIHCAKGVKRAIAELDGIESVIVNLDAKQATIKGSATDEDVIKAIDRIGFKATNHNKE